jgi:hypothetical protein
MRRIIGRSEHKEHYCFAGRRSNAVCRNRHEEEDASGRNGPTVQGSRNPIPWRDEEAGE